MTEVNGISLCSCLAFVGGLTGMGEEEEKMENGTSAGPSLGQAREPAKREGRRGRKRLVGFANFHGLNAPTITNFRLPS